MTPSYGAFQRRDDAEKTATITVLFRGVAEDVEIYRLADANGVSTILIHHAALSPTDEGRVYHDDADGRPFATDASKFAFFCNAAAVWISQLEEAPDVVHLHDWHAAFYLIVRDFSSLGEILKPIRTVFTIHNLAYQGQRPFEGDPSSLVAWFPGMLYDPEKLRDPASATAFNPMAYAIRCADRVNTVSPTYSREICLPSNPELGFFGGEGLERDLSMSASRGRLTGILNGCDYSGGSARRTGWTRLVQEMTELAQAWADKYPDDPVHQTSLENLRNLPKRKPMYVLTSIGRVVSQKMQLFVQTLGDGQMALDHILNRIGRQGVLVLLGSGEQAYEDTLHETARRQPRLIYLNGYAEALGEALYRSGDLFLMPSSFEPCGISQMAAMRAGQPCVVHGTGGLRDTVIDSRTGFVFEGASPAGQAANFVASVARGLDMRKDHPASFANMQNQARQQRFDWDYSAKTYIETLYEHD